MFTQGPPRGWIDPWVIGAGVAAVLLGVAVSGGPGLAEMFHDRGWDVLTAVSGADAELFFDGVNGGAAVLSESAIVPTRASPSPSCRAEPHER